jgi:hypothetical protein
LDDFAKYIEVNVEREIKLFLYNIDTETTREVSITPKRNWGG